MQRPPTTGARPDDERATRFTAVATDVWEPVQRYLRRRARPDDVDDLAAETLTVVWRRLDDIPVGAEIPWSFSIARRCLANHRRGDVRRRNLVDRMIGRRDTRPAHVEDPAASIEHEDPQLHAALAQLSTDDRELLTLWSWEQLTVGEIAIALGVNPNTVSVRLRRARQRVSDHLQAGGKGTSGNPRPARCHIVDDAGHTADGCTQETPR